MTTAKELITEHTREMVSAAMAYALGALAEDPGRLRRMDQSGTLGDALAPDVAEFMKYRGGHASAGLEADLKEVAN